jgi:primosomal protein N' (replication factor Y)
VPDVPAIDRPLDYLVPDRLDGSVRVGTLVRVPLHGRRVRGWVVARGDRAATDRPLQAVARVTGWGPDADLVDLAGWAAWRWAGTTVAFLRAASPPGAIAALPPPATARPPTGVPAAAAGRAWADPLVTDAFGGGAVAVRLPPAADPLPLALEAASRGDALVLVPSVSGAAFLAARLRRAGHAVALLPHEWAAAAAGGCVAVGSRAAAWAPRPRLGAVLVVDEHDDRFQEERAPTWHARDVVLERAGRAGVPCVLASPCPSLETLATARLVAPSRRDERDGWPVVDVVDRRDDEPGSGLYSARLVAMVRRADDGRRVVCVLNRRGRARLLACGTCGELARCEVCGALVEEAEGGLRCRRCHRVRPVVCAACGSARLKALRVGVSRAREELEHLAGRPVAEVTAEAAPGPPPRADVLVGTSAVLHRLAGAWAVAFLDFDQELLAPRWRAAEEALALLARAARLVGGRSEEGRVLIQTRAPDHEVIDAVVHADPSRLTVVESARRVALGLPPERAVAVVSGEAAGTFVGSLRGAAGVEVLGPHREQWLVKARDHRSLCDALAATPRPRGRLRVAVDPLRT